MKTHKQLSFGLIYTFKRLIQFIFSEHNSQVMHRTGMKLHPEYDISAGTSETFVIALELGRRTLHALKGLLRDLLFLYMRVPR